MPAISLSSKNEVTIYPEFKIEAIDYDNMTAPAKMGVVFKKMNGMVLRDRAIETKVVDGQATQSLNTVNYVKELFVRFVNPIQVTIDEAGERDLTLADVLEYQEFTELLSAMFGEATKIVNRGAVEVKKS